MKKMLALVLALAMCLGCAALAEETALVYALGAPMPDFTFTDINGVSHTLSETLKEKEMVLINLWATWCGPCESEFPFLEEAYEQYKDKVEVFALSIDENDDDAKLTEYVASHGLTFPVGHETFNLFAGFGLTMASQPRLWLTASAMWLSSQRVLRPLRTRLSACSVSSSAMSTRRRMCWRSCRAKSPRFRRRMKRN